MGKKRKPAKGTVKKQQPDYASRTDVDTAEVIRDILEQETVDLSLLRKVAAVRGLVNSHLRARVWPLLLGIDAARHAGGKYDAETHGDHGDVKTVNDDVARSLHSFTAGWPEAMRDERREALHRVLTAATVHGLDAGVHYYQGMHDVAAVLLFVAGERPAYRMLCHLSTCHLRDCTRRRMDAVVELLPLMLLILREEDLELHQHIVAETGDGAVWGMSWFLTWLSHTTPGLAQSARLFDLFMASHPLMPLYVGAVAVQASKATLLKLEDGAVHAYLANMRVLDVVPVETLVAQAGHLYQRFKPDKLIRTQRIYFRHATAPGAFLVDSWHVPERPSAPPPQPRRAGRLLRRLAVPAAAVLATSAGLWMALQSPGGSNFGGVHLAGLAGLLSAQQ